MSEITTARATAAAQAARLAGNRLRIVVDGLDEADGDGPALGLPAVLPPGVEVLATYRDGIAPTRLPSSDGAVTIALDADDPANMDDLRQFLLGELSESALAARLTVAGLAEDHLVDMLAERSGGVWVYVRYVLGEMHGATWRKEDLDQLPSGLAGYYRRHVTGRRHDPAFHDEDLPVLATLAAAAQPVTVQQITGLTSLPPGLVRTLCNFRYRPFLAITSDPGRSPRYSLYHASLREFLHGRPIPGDTGADPVDGIYLREAIHAAHDRIADHYLNLLGGRLDAPEGVSIDPSWAELDDRYALSHLPVHLHHAGRHSDLHALLTCPDQPDAPLGSAWTRAHDRSGTLGTYLAHIDLARSAAERHTDQQIAAGRTAASLGEESVYALLAADLTSRSSAIPDTLLEALVESGHWDLDRALAHAYRIGDPDQRADALIALIPHVADQALLDQACDDALAAICAGSWRRGARDDRYCRLTARLDSDQVERALGAAAAFTEDSARVAVLAALGCDLNTAQTRRALDIASAIADCRARAQALASLSSALDSPERDLIEEQALDSAARIPRQRERAHTLALIAPHLTRPRSLRTIGEALDLTVSPLAWTRPPEPRDVVVEFMFGLQGTTLAELAPHLTNAQLERAINASGTFTRPERTRALAALAPHAGAISRSRAIEQVLAAAAHDDDDGRAFAYGLASIGPYLSQEQSQHALDIATSLPEHDARAHALANLADHLDGPSRTHALEEARAAAAEVKVGRARARTLTEVAMHMDPPGRPGTLEQALHAATAPLDSQGARARALVRLAAHLEGTERSKALDDALAPVATHDADTQRSPWLWIEALAEMAARLNAAQRDKALSVIAGVTHPRIQARALVALVPHLDVVQLHIALETVKGNRDKVARVKVMAAVSDHLPDAARTSVLDQAVDAVSQIEDRTRADIMRTLGDRLSPAQVSRAVNDALTIDHPYTRALTLAALAGHLDGADRDQVLGAVMAAAAVADTEAQAALLAEIALHFRDQERLELIDQAIETAARDTGDGSAAGVLARASDCLDIPCLERVLPLTREPGREVSQVRVLSKLAALSQGARRADFLDEALDATASIDQPYDRAESLELLAAQLNNVQRTRALDIANATEDAALRPLALAGVAGIMDGNQLGSLLEASTSLRLLSMRHVAEPVIDSIASKANRASPHDAVKLIRRAYHARPSRELILTMIGATAITTARLGGRIAIQTQVKAVSRF